MVLRKFMTRLAHFPQHLTNLWKYSFGKQDCQHVPIEMQHFRDQNSLLYGDIADPDMSAVSEEGTEPSVSCDNRPISHGPHWLTIFCNLSFSRRMGVSFWNAGDNPDLNQ
jgi:hypothetical protein